MLMPPISRYMTRQPWTVHHDAPLSHAMEVMREHNIRHLPVLEDGKLVGVISERDVFKLERFKYLGNHFKVEDAMTDDVYTADIDQPVDEVVQQMSENKYGSTVVMSGRYHVEGIFTTVDGMQVLADVLRRAVA